MQTINVKQNVKDHDHECIECKKWFSSIGSLYHHFKNIHPHLQVPKHMQPITIQMLMKGFNSNKCLRCKLSFKTHFSIQKHFQKNHSTRIYLCPECNRGCLYERSIKKHWLKMHKRKSFPVQNVCLKLPISVLSSFAFVSTNNFCFLFTFHLDIRTEINELCSD